MKKEELIENILENFDFEKVKKVMDFLGWTYYDSEETPSTYRLIKSAKRLLEDTYERALNNKTLYSTSCGGFKVMAHYCEEKEEIFSLSLEFILESWHKNIYED